MPGIIFASVLVRIIRAISDAVHSAPRRNRIMTAEEKRKRFWKRLLIILAIWIVVLPIGFLSAQIKNRALCSRRSRGPAKPGQPVPRSRYLSPPKIHQDTRNIKKPESLRSSRLFRGRCVVKRQHLPLHNPTQAFLNSATRSFYLL